METYFRSNGDQHEQSITTVKMTLIFVVINDSHFHDAVLSFSLQNYNDYSNLVL